MPVLEKIKTFNVLTRSEGLTVAVIVFPVSVLMNTAGTVLLLTSVQSETVVGSDWAG